MADASPNFAIRQFTVQPTTPLGAGLKGGTPIIAPIGCTQATLENTDPTSAIQVFTDPLDATTVKNIPAGLELTLRASVLAWGPNATICYVAGTGIQGVCTVTFLR